MHKPHIPTGVVAALHALCSWRQLWVLSMPYSTR